MKLLVPLGCCLLLAACGGGVPNHDAQVPTVDSVSGLTSAQWSDFQDAAYALLGKWESVQDSGRTVFNEQWERADDRFFRGIGYVMSGPDTVFVENLALYWDSVPTYSVRTPSQNGGDHVAFTWRNDCCEAGKLVFENPEHDWPQVISYTRTASGWSAVVSGKDKGNHREARFDFVPRKDALPGK